MLPGMKADYSLKKSLLSKVPVRTSGVSRLWKTALLEVSLVWIQQLLAGYNLTLGY